MRWLQQEGLRSDTRKNFLKVETLRNSNPGGLWSLLT